VLARRPRKHPDQPDDTIPAGLSRRGWLLLVAITAGIGAVLLVVGVVATGIPGSGARAATSPTPAALAPHTFDPGSAPTPLGLPPRPTTTHVATVPAVPVASISRGDCLQTYDSKWADGYPVIDCSQQHIAQLLTKGDLPQPAGSAFPGTAALDSQISDLCEPFLNWHWVAIWGEDVQLDLRYPDTDAKWATGDRSYYCIVYTFSRHELTGSALAGE
jgi:hypothetical protein